MSRKFKIRDHGGCPFCYLSLLFMARCVYRICLKQRRKLFSVARKFICYGSDADIGKVSLSEGLLWEDWAMIGTSLSRRASLRGKTYARQGCFHLLISFLTEFSL